MTLKSILLVEDDESVRSGLKLLFEGEGYHVFVANHGQDALDILEKRSSQKIGLILLDYMMPVMDGPTFLQKLQLNHPQILVQIPIFIITALENDILQARIKTTGFLRKPFDVEKLFSVVTQYCGTP